MARTTANGRFLLLFLIVGGGIIGYSGIAGDALPFRTDRILVKPKANTVAGRTAVAAVHTQLNGAVTRSFSTIGGLQVVTLPQGADVQATIAAYNASGTVEYAEPDYIVHAVTDPNDPLFVDGTQWDFKNTGQSGGTAGADISAEGGWSVRTDASGVIVAVIDTGIRYTHQDLAPNMWHNPSPSGINDVFGINAITGSGDPMDDNGHGSHTAGTVGAAGNNGLGTTGVAWKVQLMACKFLNSSGSGSLSDAITCIDYARTHGAQIMTNSWGGGPYTQALFDAINNARAAGILFVVAAGNSTSNNDGTPTYPANYNLDNIVSVASTNRNDGLSSFSNFGYQTVHVGAPGEQITSCWNTSDTATNTISGTSMATPHVSGLFALLKAQFPGDTYLDLKYRMFYSVDRIPSLLGKCKTGGRINMAKALTSTLTHPANDNFSNAITLSGSLVSTTGSNAGATKESGEPNHATDPGGKSVWWKWTCQLSGSVTIATEGSNFDTLLGVYTGSSVSSLTQVAANDDVSGTDKTSSVTFSATAGTTYHIAVDGWGFDSGTISLSIVAPNIPPSVSITAPADGATFVSPATISIKATASDADGTVTKVEFFNGATNLGQATTPPYSFTWSNVTPGSYTLTAKATDNAGGTTTSSAVNITVNPPPTVAFASATYTANETSETAAIGVSLSAAATTSVQVHYATSNGTAKSGTNYTAASGTLTFAPGATTQSFNVTLANDGLPGPDTTVNLTLSSPVNANLGTAAAVLTIHDDDPPAPLVTSAASAAPNPATVGQSVTFTAAASNAKTYTWDFGDGTSGSGSSVTHTYSAAGSFTAKVTASNAAGTIQSSVAVTVNAAPPGNSNPPGPGGQPPAGGGATPPNTDLALDNNGFPNALKQMLGMALNAPAPSPYSGKPLPLTIAKMSIHLNLATSDSDGIALSGTLNVPAGFAPMSQTFVVDIGGVIQSLTLDSKGRSRVSNASLSIQIKSKKGAVAAQKSKFALKLSHGAFAATLSSAGLTNTTVSNAKVNVMVTALFNSTFLQANQPQTYSAIKDKRGSTK